MNDLLLSLLVFALIFGGALVGVVVRPLLSEEHLHPDSKGRCKNGNGPHWHLSRTCAGPVDRVREKLLRPENQPGQANDRDHNPSGRSACAVWSRSNACPESSAAEHPTVGQSHLA